MKILFTFLLTSLGVLCLGTLPWHPAAPRKIVSPATVPPWAQTGKFRPARWDGGPIEAAKGRLTGWPNYSADDPRQVLRATRDWYNPKTIEFLRLAHINWAWVTWSVGFSPSTERQQWSLVSNYIRLCHQKNIHVTAYISIGNMFWQDMFSHVPGSIAWVRRDYHGGPLFYTRPNRYMADIANADWIGLQKRRVENAVRAGADGLWIDNTFSYYRPEDVAHLIDVLYGTAAQVNPHFVIMSNYNRHLLTWGRLQNGVTTEDGLEPGYYNDRSTPYLVTNAGLLRYVYGIGEGWRPVSVEDGQRHNGDRLTTPMAPRKWQLAIAETAMYHVGFEPFFEGLFLRNLYFHEPRALEELHAIGTYNSFLERNEQYYTNPRSLARVAILSDTTDDVVPYLNQISEKNLNYDVIFNYQAPGEAALKRYKVVVLPNTNPLSRGWCTALSRWVENDGGTLIAVQDASLFSDGAAVATQDFGLGNLLGISKEKLPASMQVRQHGKGRSVYLPSVVPAEKMVSLIRQYLQGSELLSVDLPTGTLSNTAYQPQYHRVILHLLNYRQKLEKGIKVQVRAPVKRAEVISPDFPDQVQARVQSHKAGSEIFISELATYDVVIIYLRDKGVPANDLH